MDKLPFKNTKHIVGILFFSFLTILIYLPGLSSGFFLDDFPNLSQLGLIEENGFIHYFFSGSSSFLGRPLSLLSFALQYPAWPDNPFAFKVVNLTIHLLNGVLISLIFSFLTLHLKLTVEERYIFIFGVSMLWLLHPIQLTTTLYVVQRMTQLSALFTLSGVLFYLYARPELINLQNIKSGIWKGICLIILMLCAILSKENGILLPLFILVIEFTICKDAKRENGWYRWAFIFLCAPLLILSAYLLFQLDGILAGYESKPYTLYQRTITQGVVLADYIQHIVVPNPSAFTLYHDDYPVYRNILGSTPTLLSLLFIGFLLLLAIYLIKIFPVISFGILWFFAGHLLESTFLNLELYFEHRNYLPSLGIISVLIWIAIMIWRKITNNYIAILLISTYLFMVIAVTLIEVKQWSQPENQAIEWVRAHPGSLRALGNLGSRYLTSGNISQAHAVYEHMASEFPDDIYPDLVLAKIQSCTLQKEIGINEWNRMIEKAKSVELQNYNILTEIHLIVEYIDENNCIYLDKNMFLKFIVTLAENRNFYSINQRLYDQAAILSVKSGAVDDALNFLDRAINKAATVTRKLFKLELLIATGNFDEAEKLYITIYNELENDFRDKILFSGELERLRKMKNRNG